MKKRCCRKLPRCAGCPIRPRAAVSARAPAETAALVTEILCGRPPRALPEPVAATLDELDRAVRRA